MSSINPKAPTAHGLPLDGYVRVSQLIEILRLSRTSIWRLERDQVLPASVRLGRNKVFRVADIREFIATHGKS
jgi:predicted DNA-binding transcriptional regulator AlpA